jgi:16S rRNA G1207 methylase RsmC
MDDINIKKIKQDILFSKELRGNTIHFKSTWGLFSPKDVDEGSELLINNVDINPNDITLDIGCGYGPIGLAIAKLSPLGKVHLIDKDYVAVEYARKNAELNSINNCEIYLSNVFSNVPDIQFDNIVSNLPAKVSKELFWIILEDSKKHLKPGGKLYVVTISGLKEFIKRNFKNIFGNYEKLVQNKTYTVALAVKGS